MEHSMGLFCVNFHFRTTDDKALSNALDGRKVRRYRVVPGKTGWTSLYEEQATEQDEGRIRELGAGLSKDLHVAAIAFLVHDSDIACYWLFDNGQLLDHYNSDPDYFGNSDSPRNPAGGRPDILARYCRKGVREEELAAILGEENVRATTFAEDVIRRLAKALGISPGLANADYRDAASDDGPGGMDGPDDDDDDDGPSGSPLRSGLVERLVKHFGFDAGGTPADPQVTTLVKAAAAGNVEEIDGLLAQGAAIEGEGPLPLQGGQITQGLAQFFPGGVPQVLMTPLLAAVANKQRQAAERLLQAGADPNRVHPRYGTAVHAATGAGDVEMLQLLINHGGDVSARNAQGQTPLEVLTASRTAMDRMAQMQATMESMGVKLPGLVGPMSNVTLPTEGCEACERLLKAHGAR
jgi:hypothetical protein